MNVKETMEMIAYLKEKREEAAQMRNYYQERLAKVIEEGSDEQNQEYLKGEASKSGIEVSRLDYFIRILEQIEVTR